MRLAPVLLVSAACVSTDVDPVAADNPVGQSVVIPFSDGAGNGPVDTYYKSILGQMHEAYLERNPDQLATLLGKHDGPNAPAWAREILPRYRSLAKALEFETWIGDASHLEAVEVPLGEPLEMLLVVPPRPAVFVALAGEDGEHPAAFRVTFEVEDHDSRGDVVLRQSSSILRLPDELVLAGDTALRLPITLELPAMAAVIRNVTARTELMPGYVQIDREQVPHSRVACAETEVTLYPAGVEPIRRAPRVTLQRAMELADVDHFPHVFLAAHFMSEPYVEESMTALMDWVRLGTEEQQQVAMAAMSMLADTDIQVRDRRRWLEWWQHRNKG